MPPAQAFHLRLQRLLCHLPRRAVYVAADISQQQWHCAGVDKMLITRLLFRALPRVIAHEVAALWRHGARRCAISPAPADVALRFAAMPFHAHAVVV